MRLNGKVTIVIDGSDRAADTCCRTLGDRINTLKSNSNLSCDIQLRFDGSINFCGVAEWTLYGFIRGFVDGWGDHWKKIPNNELVELENSSQLERR